MMKVAGEFGIYCNLISVLAFRFRFFFKINVKSLS